MKIDVSEIVKTNGASLDIEFNEVLEDIDPGTNDFVFGMPVDFKGSLTNNSGVLHLNGRMKTEYDVKCYRCLKDMEKHLDVAVKEDFIDGRKNADDEAYTYESNYIVIDRVLRDNIILNLPMRQVCTDECKGICSKCGIDLNEKPCDCEDNTINPKLEVLKNFFNN